MASQERVHEVTVYDKSGTDPLDIVNGRAQVDIISTPSDTGNASYASASTATAGATQVIASPGGTSSLQVRYVHANNGGSGNVTVAFREGSGGSDFFVSRLAANGGQWNANLISSYRQLTADTSLFVTLSGAQQVYVEVGYRIV
jgi:hypothetical protein